MAERDGEVSTVIITGSRNWHDIRAIYAALDQEHQKNPITLLVEGGADGADDLGRRWAVKNGIAVDTIPAEWSKEGRSAGPKRNIAMLDKYPGARVLAFPLPESKGTVHCMKEARKRGMAVIDYGQA